IKKNIRLINEDYDEVKKLNQSAFKKGLPYFINMGKILKANQDALPHGQFEKYVKANHEFSVRTARVYMQCAEKETDLEALRAEVGGDCVDSIRKALWLIKPQSDRDTITNRLAKARETAKANKLKRSAAETTGPSSFDLKATLDNTAPDEVV